MYAAIEAGGTKFVCAVSDQQLNIVGKTRIATTNPQQTLRQVFAFLDQYAIEAIGVGAFGPLDLDNQSSHYGYITTTPKAGWRDFNFLGVLKAHFGNIPIIFTTDVNIAAVGEQRLGAGRGAQNVAYYTVGTGIGMGFLYHGALYTGRGNLEAGHILVRRSNEDKFAGVCPYHSDCLEGMASGPAMESRWGLKGADIPTDSFAWRLEANYLAQACMITTLSLSPDIIIFGGGVSNRSELFPLIRSEFSKILGDYVTTPNLAHYIVHAALGNDAGIAGGLLLAKDAAVKINTSALAPH